MLIPEETPVIDAGQQAAIAGLKLICNGRESRISPDVPRGWFSVAVKIKPTASANCGSRPCAA